VFLGTSIGVLSTTLLAGASTVWAQEAATEIGNVPVAYMDFRPSDNTLAVGTHGRGVFTGQFQPVTNGVGDRGSPRHALLGPSRPNPARGETSIAFDLPRDAPVSLRLYDVAGREVAVLVNDRRSRGHHVVPITTARLAPGAYRCVLRAGDDVETQPLVVRR